MVDNTEEDNWGSKPSSTMAWHRVSVALTRSGLDKDQVYNAINAMMIEGVTVVLKELA